MSINAEIDSPTPKKEKGKHTQLINKKNRVRFDKALEQVYVQALKYDPNINVLQATIARPIQDRESIDNIILQVNNMLLGAAKKASLMKKRQKFPPNEGKLP